jgi:hypothetical protein
LTSLLSRLITRDRVVPTLASRATPLIVIPHSPATFQSLETLHTRYTLRSKLPLSLIARCYPLLRSHVHSMV